MPERRAQERPDAASNTDDDVLLMSHTLCGQHPHPQAHTGKHNGRVRCKTCAMHPPCLSFLTKATHMLTWYSLHGKKTFSKHTETTFLAATSHVGATMTDAALEASPTPRHDLCMRCSGAIHLFESLHEQAASCCSTLGHHVCLQPVACNPPPQQPCVPQPPQADV